MKAIPAMHVKYIFTIEFKHFFSEHIAKKSKCVDEVCNIDPIKNPDNGNCELKDQFTHNPSFLRRPALIRVHPWYRHLGHPGLFMLKLKDCLFQNFFTVKPLAESVLLHLFPYSLLVDQIPLSIRSSPFFFILCLLPCLTVFLLSNHVLCLIRYHVHGYTEWLFWEGNPAIIPSGLSCETSCSSKLGSSFFMQGFVSRQDQSPLLDLHCMNFLLFPKPFQFCYQFMIRRLRVGRCFSWQPLCCDASEWVLFCSWSRSCLRHVGFKFNATIGGRFWTKQNKTNQMQSAQCNHQITSMKANHLQTTSNGFKWIQIQ